MNPIRQLWRNRRAGGLQVAGIVISAVLLAIASHGLWLPAIGHWLALPPDPQPADVIVVLGGNQVRIDHAVSLYQQGRAAELWITGDPTLPPETNRGAQSMARRAQQAGVPNDAILLLPTASTWEDGRAIAAQVQERDLHTILIVTNWYHSRRALCVARQHLHARDAQVFYDPVPDPHHGPDNWWTYKYRRAAVLGELAKLPLYVPLHGLNLLAC